MSAVASTSSRVPAPRNAALRWFHPLTALLLLALVVVGFSRFYLQGRAHPDREIPPPIRTLVIAHAVAMSAWMVVFALQPLLVATRRRGLHVKLGRVGVVVAVLVVGLGVVTAVRSAQVTPSEVVLWTLAPGQFLAVSAGTVVFFGAAVALAIAMRRRPEAHRALMLTGTLAIVGAAVSRIDACSAVYVGTAWERWFGPFLATIALAFVLLGVRCILARRVDRWLTGGVIALTLFALGTMALARTGAWAAIMPAPPG